MTFSSPSELGRLDIADLGMWINLDGARRGVDGELANLAARAADLLLDDGHRTYLGSLSDEAERSDAIALFTAVAHECRHFHDLLLTPYGALMMSHHVRMAFTVLSSLGSLHSSRAIIVPIARWVELLPLLGRLDPALKEPSPKLLSLIDVLEDVRSDLAALDRGVEHPEAPITATQILESSAWWVQMGFAGRAFGLDGANELSRRIASAPARARYLGTLEYIHERVGWLPSAASQILMLASLSGNVFNTASLLRSPVDMMVALTDWLAEQSDFPAPRPTAETDANEVTGRVYDLVNEFFGRQFGEDLAGVMIAATDQTTANVNEWERRLAGKEDGSFTWQWVRNAADVYRNFDEVSGRLVANFSMNPIWYLVDGYLDVIRSLPRPVTYMWSEYGLASSPDFLSNFRIHQELVVPHQPELFADPQLADMVRLLKAKAYDDGESLRLALAFSVKAIDRDPPPPRVLMFDVEDLDPELWTTYFDTVVPLLRLLTDGPSEALPVGLMAAPLQVLDATGTKVYSPSGLLAPEPFVNRTNFAAS